MLIIFRYYQSLVLSNLKLSFVIDACRCFWKLIMWRIVLFITLFCSLALNVYFFMQISVYSIESEINQELNVIKKHDVVRMKTERGNDIVSPNSTQIVAIKIKNAIISKDYFIAIFLINTLANDYKAESELAEVRLFWLEATKALIKEGFYINAENSISAYLSYEQDDVGFLHQQIDLFWQQQLSISAIRYAYEMQYHVFNENKKRDVLNFARELVQQKTDELIKNNLWVELQDFIEEVIIFDPDDVNLQWLFVNAQYQLGEFELALNAIEPFLNLSNYKIKAQALLEKIKAALRKPESIPLSRQGQHFIVQAVIDDSFQVSLMLDTGASISLISESAFETLKQYSNVTYIKDLNLNTAGGQITASTYQVAEFSIQGYIINDFTFVVSPFISEENDGLLGMNFLRNFDFHIDQENSVLILKNK